MLTKFRIKIFYSLLIFFFFSTKLLANNEYFKCPEKVLKVISGQNHLLKVGSILGVNYVKFHINKSITIKFKYSDSNDKPIQIISDQKLIKNSLGYEVNNKVTNKDQYVENTYNFIKINDSYAFTRNENWWSPNSESQSNKNYEYESSGRCLKIKKDEFNLGKIVKISDKKKIKKKEKLASKSKVVSTSNIIRGKRSFAMSWEGYDDLILGKITFTEQDLFGKIKFSLPNDDGNCIGTYALSQTKGTWSFICLKKNINASGTLSLNSLDGEVNGKGKDNFEKKIKFKISAKD